MMNDKKVVGYITIYNDKVGLSVRLPVFPGDTPSGVAKEYWRRWEEKYGKENKEVESISEMFDRMCMERGMKCCKYIDKTGCKSISYNEVFEIKRKKQ